VHIWRCNQRFQLNRARNNQSIKNKSYICAGAMCSHFVSTWMRPSLNVTGVAPHQQQLSVNLSIMTQSTVSALDTQQTWGSCLIIALCSLETDRKHIAARTFQEHRKPCMYMAWLVYQQELNTKILPDLPRVMVAPLQSYFSRYRVRSCSIGRKMSSPRQSSHIACNV